jgi:aryl carrier-like protein
VNRRALPAPDVDTTGASDVAAPRTPAEELLFAIWSEILGRKNFGVNDNFFDLGGHSLLATRLVSRIRRTFHVDLALRAVFASPTIAELAQAVDRARRASEKDDTPPLVRKPRTMAPDGTGAIVFPLSFSEQRLWMLDRLQPNSSVYNLSLALRLTGQLQVDALEHAWTEVLRRHEVLRASFRQQGHEPQQYITPLLPVSFPILDLTGKASPSICQPARFGALVW